MRRRVEVPTRCGTVRREPARSRGGRYGRSPACVPTLSPAHRSSGRSPVAVEGLDPNSRGRGSSRRPGGGGAPGDRLFEFLGLALLGCSAGPRSAPKAPRAAPPMPPGRTGAVPKPRRRRAAPPASARRTRSPPICQSTNQAVGADPLASSLPISSAVHSFHVLLDLAPQAVEVQVGVSRLQGIEAPVHRLDPQGEAEVALVELQAGCRAPGRAPRGGPPACATSGRGGRKRTPVQAKTNPGAFFPPGPPVPPGSPAASTGRHPAHFLADLQNAPRHRLRKLSPQVARCSSTPAGEVLPGGGGRSVHRGIGAARHPLLAPARRCRRSRVAPTPFIARRHRLPEVLAQVAGGAHHRLPHRSLWRRP